MIPATCKRLIEVDFPIAKVSEFSAKEKSIRHGHPSTLHLWWARRPLAACRSVLLGLLLPDPCDKDCPPDFATKAWEILSRRFPTSGKSKEALRETLLSFIGEFANWELASEPMFLGIARGLVKAAHPEEPPVVADPFAGGGSIPLEALRLGCEAFASDLNPVACLILKILLEDIPRYANADFSMKDRGGKEIVVHGVAQALRHVGGQIKSVAERELADVYPVDPDGSRPIAYLWARTVRCEAVGCGAEIPLMRSFWLCNKAGRKRALRYSVVRPRVKTPHVEFEIFTPKSDKEVPGFTVDRANATCLCCQNVLPAVRVRAQLAMQNGGADVVFGDGAVRSGGATMLAVVLLNDAMAGRDYRLPKASDYSAVRKAHDALSRRPDAESPDEDVPTTELRRISVPLYGMRRYSNMFTRRQLLALSTLARCVASHAESGDQTRALKRLLAISINKTADLGNALTPWKPDAECPVHLYARQAVGMAWDWAESAPLGGASGSFESAFDRTASALTSAMVPADNIGNVQCADAAHSPLPSQSVGVWFTDPPYYDSVPYAHLADFFYIWLKRSLKHTDAALLTDVLTNKSAECVVDRPHSLSKSEKTPQYYESKIADAMREGRRVLRDDGVGTIVFAHKTTEGWESLLTGILRSGLVITASWPITTEMASRMVARDTAALAGSVHLVCRPRLANAGSGDWGEVKAAMERRIREWLPTLSKHGVRGADAIFSCLGPALESYSRYDGVLTAADHEVPLGGDPDATEPHQRGFLAYVFEALSKEALREILGTADTEGFEEDARMTALFLWTLQSTKPTGKADAAADADDSEEEGDEDEQKPGKKKAGFSMPFDTFIRITRPMGIHYPTMEGSLIEIEKGLVRLLPARERSEALLGEAGTRPGVEITLDDVKQLEFAFTRKKAELTLPAAKKGGRKGATPAQQQAEGTFTTLDRLHRAMLLFTLGRSTLLRQVLETEMRAGKRFERLALALNALYPDGSDERRMLEGVQSAMRGVK
jgi:putative DNA methylase